MNSLPNYCKLTTPQVLVYCLCTNMFYKINRFVDQTGRYTVLQVLYLQISDLNTLEIITSTALQRTEHSQNLK